MWFMLLLTTAVAARLPEVAVVGVHVQGLDEAGGEEASARIGEAVERTQAMTYVEPQFVSAKLKGREALVLEDFALKDGRDLLEEGRVLYQNAEPDEAIPLLQMAAEELELGIAATGNTDFLIEAWLTLGLAHTGMGDEEAANAAFREVIILDPTRELDPISYPPDVIEGYARVRTDVLSAGTGQLALNATADGAEVFVDGRSVGVAPVTVEGLPVGRHRVFVTADGGLRAYEEVLIEAGGTRKLSLKVDERQITETAEDRYGRSAQVESLYGAVGSYAQTPLVLLAGETGEGQVAVLLYSSRTNNFSHFLTAPAGEDPVGAIVDLIPALGSYVTETGDIRPERVSVSVPPFAVSDNAVLEQILLDPNEDVQIQYIEKGAPWYLWAAGGGIAAAGIGVGVYAVLSEPTGTDPKDNGTITIVLP
jgi:hypothetical protein